MLRILLALVLGASLFSTQVDVAAQEEAPATCDLGEDVLLGPDGVFGAGAVRLDRDAGVGLPKPMRQVNPTYTEAARQAKLQGVVDTEIVVLADGSVGAMRVTRSLDTTYGLDDAALCAASPVAVHSCDARRDAGACHRHSRPCVPTPSTWEYHRRPGTRGDLG